MQYENTTHTNSYRVTKYLRKKHIASELWKRVQCASASDNFQFSFQVLQKDHDEKKHCIVKGVTIESCSNDEYRSTHILCLAECYGTITIHYMAQWGLSEILMSVLEIQLLTGCSPTDLSSQNIRGGDTDIGSLKISICCFLRELLAT